MSSRWALLGPMLASVAVAMTMVSLPTVLAQVALLGATVVTILSVMLARAGRLLNAGWVIVLGVYILDPLGGQLAQAGAAVTSLDIVAIAPIPFVLAALWLRPDTRGSLVRLAPQLFLLGLAVLSLQWSADAEYGIRKISIWITTGLIPGAFILVLASPTRPVAWRLVAVAAFIYVVVLLMVGAATTDAYPGRLVAFDANPIWIARAAYIGVLVTLFGPIPAVLKVVMIIPMLLAGHLTDSLGPTLGLIVGVGIGVTETLRVAHRSDRRAPLAWAGVGLALAISLTVGATLLISAGSTALAPVVGDPNVTSRAAYYEIGAKMFATAPVFGAGLGAFVATGADFYPHNLVVEVAAELGLVGLAALGFWLLMAIRGALGSPLLLSLVAATSIYVLFSGSIASNAEFWMCTAVAVAMLPVQARASRARAPGVPVVQPT